MNAATPDVQVHLTIPALTVDLTVDPLHLPVHEIGEITAFEVRRGTPRITLRFHTGAVGAVEADGDEWTASGEHGEDLEELSEAAGTDIDRLSDIFDALWRTARSILDQVIQTALQAAPHQFLAVLTAST